MDVYKIAQENRDYIYGLRRYFHENPELSWEEVTKRRKRHIYNSYWKNGFKSYENS